MHFPDTCSFIYVSQISMTQLNYFILFLNFIKLHFIHVTIIFKKYDKIAILCSVSISLYVVLIFKISMIF